MNKKKERILVVVAHPDDEILGMGGTLLKHKAHGDQISILFLSNGEESRDIDVDVSKRLMQAENVARKLKAHVYFENFPDNQFDSVPLLTIAKTVEKVVKKVKPTIVYTSHLHDLNVDHRLAVQAVLTACRPKPKSTVKKVATFEILSSTEWQAKTPQNMFCPNEYSDITFYIDKKIDLLKIYKDEMGTYPHPRSEKGVKILAQYRGIEVGYRYAEAFHVIRNLIK